MQNSSLLILRIGHCETRNKPFFRSPALDRSAGEQSTLRVPGATGRSGLIAVQMATHFLYSRLVDTSVPTLKKSIAKG